MGLGGQERRPLGEGTVGFTRPNELVANLLRLEQSHVETGSLAAFDEETTQGGGLQVGAVARAPAQ